jgi:hypothetical protein
MRKVSNDINYFKKIFSSVRQGEYDCFSFNPNLYVFRIEDSSLSIETQQTKTTLLKPDDTSDINQMITRFFSSHIILFWIFMVFFICTICVIVIKVFKIGSILA